MMNNVAFGIYRRSVAGKGHRLFPGGFPQHFRIFLFQRACLLSRLWHFPPPYVRTCIGVQSSETNFHRR